ncbi:hypothetical protein [Longispora albida]|uniref:hypothetical protein n=1 Tax=Longispora albida TaxID=203523 RepID=UPI000381E486|nr:hypothetical protein [Longispora albida]
MSERPAFPKRDDRGRITVLTDMLAAVTASLVLSLAVVLVIDLVAVAFGAAFGQSSGWLGVILPAWLFTEEFRAWRGTPGRGALAAFGVVFSLVAGMSAGFTAEYLPALASGAIGAAVCVLAYLLIWFFGIRWLARRAGE